MAEKKNVLIVFAHMDNKKSFNAALLDVTKTTLAGRGHTVTVSDLYSMGFNPVIGKHDIQGLNDKDGFHYIFATADATKNGKLAKDIQAEQKKVSDADLIIFQFPMQWYSMPAMLKGWIERVMTVNYAYNTQTGELFERGGMKGKKALVSFTTGSGKASYGDVGMNGVVDVHTWPWMVSLRFMGFEVLKPQASYGVMSAPAEERAQMLENYKKRLQTIFNEEPQTFFPLSDFAPVGGKVHNGLVLSEPNSGKQTVAQNRAWESRVTPF